MTYSKALNILMLSFNFTEQDLKKSYRSLSKKYHPDNFITDEEKRIAHEKMCEINEAHAVLKQIKANPNSYQEDRKVNINEYREELIRKIYKFLLPSENDEYYCIPKLGLVHIPCYQKKNDSQCGEIWYLNKSFSSGNCIDPGCPRGMKYGSVNSYNWGCIDEKIGTQGMCVAHW